MFHEVEDKAFLSRMRCHCGEIMQQLCHVLKEKYDVGAQFRLVGSGARNLILQNANKPIDLDYNLWIMRGMEKADGRVIKEAARKALNLVLREYGYGECQDSTSALTTPKIHFGRGNQTEFSIDICIVRECRDGYERLIHEKTGWTYWDRYYWNDVPHSERLSEKVSLVKSQGKWGQVREEYIKLKNRYLSDNDHHPSFICYSEAVNNVYNQLTSVERRLVPGFQPMVFVSGSLSQNGQDGIVHGNCLW
ncbi:hypothetical protein [Pseudoflavonifractor sp. An176]|uniref:hypothetical protein n=1 Tax=Pseudoflavonifractor sp. An176 TaxID=1965572 RepID=UPI001FA8BA64|nr:hypothetical protein [Pseudoflavonifractor sp. An176]